MQKMRSLKVPESYGYLVFLENQAALGSCLKYADYYLSVGNC